MKKFLNAIFKFSILPLIFIVLIIVGFFIFDPMYILYSHKSYSQTNANRDFYGLEMFKKNYPTYHYDSFIFGSSRTLAFRPSSWQKYLENGASTFMLDGYGDNMYGIYHKVKYLDSLNIEISNALIILDVDESFIRDYPRDDFFFFLKHPDIDNSSWKTFYKIHIEAYFDVNYIASFYLNKFFGIENNYVNKYLANLTSSVDPITNELRRDDLERKINTDPAYHENQIFYQRPDTLVYREVQINSKQLDWLRQIKKIFDKNKTDYKIIIGPMYTQHKFNDSDTKKIIDVFGKDRVYDFSGKNEMTSKKTNYYETSHYRPLVGDSIMHYIYTHQGNVSVE